jgi:mannose-6-phosphate isomerase-like protein (cupin superfamily)
VTQARFVAAGEDRYNEQRGLGITELCIKVATEDAGGGLLVVEQTMLAKGGPARHVHLAQDEWFSSITGEFVVVVGDATYRLMPGDSLLAPRRVPHVWAYVGEGIGKILIAFSPAGQMEAFFRETTKANAMPPQDPGLWRAHGMELLGPPLAI